jgi:hypothetical protein
MNHVEASQGVVQHRGDGASLHGTLAVIARRQLLDDAPPSEPAEEESPSDMAAQPPGTLVGLRLPCAFLQTASFASMSSAPAVGDTSASSPMFTPYLRVLHRVPVVALHNVPAGSTGADSHTDGSNQVSRRSPAGLLLTSAASAASGRRTGEFSGELSGLVAKKLRGGVAVPVHQGQQHRQICDVVKDDESCVLMAMQRTYLH